MDILQSLVINLLKGYEALHVMSDHDGAVAT